MRQISLDTETTGLDPSKGDRIVEIGCVELKGRSVTNDPAFSRQYYLNPDRDVSETSHIHGLTNEFLADKPHFEDIVDEFLDFISGAELIIHNAAFDCAFLEMELKKAGKKSLKHYCAAVTDSLAIAKKTFPGKPNNLNVLCSRFGIDNSARTFHGALLDAQLLAEVYLGLTRGQGVMNVGHNDERSEESLEALPDPQLMRIIRASEEELKAHQTLLELIDKKSNQQCAWLKK